MATSSGGCWSWMAEVAGEELAKLEAAHPGRFGPLKAELRRLVDDTGLDAAAFLPFLPRTGATAAVAEHCSLLPRAATPSSQAVPPLLHLSSTQESSTQKRKPGGGAFERNGGKRRRSAAAPPGGTKDRAEMAIERAERCLERIRAVKRSLLAAWTQ